MEVASVLNYDPALGAMAFKATSEKNQNAFVLINKSEESKTVTIYVHHGDSETYDAVRTMKGEQYRRLGTLKLVNGAITYASPPRSVTTFFSL